MLTKSGLLLSDPVRSVEWRERRWELQKPWNLGVSASRRCRPTTYTMHTQHSENCLQTLHFHRLCTPSRKHLRMYPSVPGANDPPRYGGAYGGNSVPSTPQYPPPPAAGSPLASAHSLESPWGTDSSSILRVKIADDYKLDAPVCAIIG